MNAYSPSVLRMNYSVCQGQNWLRTGPSQVVSRVGCFIYTLEVDFCIAFFEKSIALLRLAADVKGSDQPSSLLYSKLYVEVAHCVRHGIDNCNEHRKRPIKAPLGAIRDTPIGIERAEIQPQPLSKASTSCICF